MIATVSAVRLQKILSSAGSASRRAAEAMIEAGRVSVNGVVVTTLGSKANPHSDDIRLDGRRVGVTQRRRYILMNKPSGYLTTRHDPERRKTVLELLPRIREYVYPVGRLDYDSEGLLLMTNDGDLAAKLIHPRYGLERVYEVVIRGVPTLRALQKLTSGIVLTGRLTASAQVQLLGGHVKRRRDQARLRVTLREGRNRQVRRMFKAVGYPVIRLRRISFGPLTAKGLKLGMTRELAAEEVMALRRAVAAGSNVEMIGQ